MRIINTLFKHPVYDGLHAVFEEVAKKTEREYTVCDDVKENYDKGLTIGKKKYLTGFRCMVNGREVAPGSRDVLIVRSMFVSAQAFSSTLRGRKTFICEESWGENSLKKGIAKTFGQLVKNQPFIAHVPRVEKFLKSHGFQAYYVPCFLEKRFSYKKGDHILYVARLVDIKHPEIIVELAKRMKHEKFVIVATKPPKDTETYQRTMAAIRLLPNVTVHEKLPYARLLELYATAKVLLLPSESDPIGYCVLEALSYGTPVITTTFTGSSDYLPKEWVMDSFDGTVWENAVQRAIDDESRARTQARKAFVDGKLELKGMYFRSLVDSLAKEITK